VKAATNSAVEKFASATTRSCCFASTIGVAAIAAAARCTAYSNRNFFGDAL
jgi:glyoxylate carboligase